MGRWFIYQEKMSSETFYSAKLMGGLGNQLFQISNALCQGFKNGVDSYFLKESWTPGEGNQTSFYVDNIFRNISFIDSYGTNLHIINELTWNDADLKIIPNTSLLFNGYFQSSKNFLGYNEELKKIFSPSPFFLKKIKKTYPNISDEKTVSIHIRRGDYLMLSDVLPILDKSYFDHCLEIIKDFDRVYVFSNDKDWAKNNFKSEKFIIVENLEDYEELWLMSLCKINVISNSSFSWWGSFLNLYENKKVFSPNTWFGPSGVHPHYNIFEDSWNKINVRYEKGFFIV